MDATNSALSKKGLCTPLPEAMWVANPSPSSLPFRNCGRSSVAASAAFHSVPFASDVTLFRKLVGAESAAMAPGRSARDQLRHQPGIDTRRIDNSVRVVVLPDLVEVAVQLAFQRLVRQAGDLRAADVAIARRAGAEIVSRIRCLR